MKISIDLGSGPEPKNPFKAENVIGIDLQDFGPNVKKCEIGFEPLPFEDSSVDFCTAFDFLEHVPRFGGAYPNRNPFIFVMNEIWRVLKNGGKFYAETPAYPFPTAFGDPTHVNYITSDTVRYFATERMGDGMLLRDGKLQLGQRYGFKGEFIALRNFTEQAYGHQIWLLGAIK